MVLDQDFEKYEQEYLERYVGGGGQNSKSLAAKAVRERRERMDAAKKTAAGAGLDSWDYVALEMIRREDLRISIKLGTMRSAESRLKLFCHGLITKRERDPTFDELERIQAFTDSVEYKQYKDRLKRLMTLEVRERLRLIDEITGTVYMWDLTDKGRRELRAKYAEMVALHNQLTKKYENDKAGFYEEVESLDWALPMMVVMGLSGTMMAHAHYTTGASYSMFGYADCLDCVDGGGFVSDVSFGF